jgi:hypothetical protein
MQPQCSWITPPVVRRVHKPTSAPPQGAGQARLGPAGDAAWLTFKPPTGPCRSTSGASCGLLSVICEPILQTSLQRVRASLDWRDRDGVPLSRRLTPDLRERWLAAGLIGQGRNGLTCHEDLCEALTRETLADGTFGEVVAASQRVFPSTVIGQQPSEQRHFRSIRLAVYQGHEDQVLQLLGLSGKESVARVRVEDTEPLSRICVRLADPT